MVMVSKYGHYFWMRKYFEIYINFQIWACFPNMVITSKYGYTLKIHQLPIMACFSKYVHTFKIQLYLKNRPITKYWQVFQIWSSFPNMVMSSKLSNWNNVLFSSLSFVPKAWKLKYWHGVHIGAYIFIIEHYRCVINVKTPLEGHLTIKLSPLGGLFSDKNARVVVHDIKSYLFLSNLIGCWNASLLFAICSWLVNMHSVHWWIPMVISSYVSA